MTSTLWLASCTTSPKNDTPAPAPRVAVPDPYDADGRLVLEPIRSGETYTAAEDCVVMPFWYWRKLFDYIIDSQAAQDINTTEK